MRKSALLALLLLPALASAAGFAKQSIFLSKSSVTEGDTVLIHAAVSSETSYSGTVAFADNTTPIGSVPVTLKAGEAQIATISWKPAAGSHKVEATLQNSGGVTEVQSATFDILPKPQPVSTTTQDASVESSAQIEQGINNLSPQVGGAVAPFFTAVDAARSAAADTLDSQLQKTKAALGPGSVLGAQTAQSATSDPMGTFMRILQTLYLYLLTLLRFIVGSAAVFYPVLAVVFLYVIWKLFRRFRRPAY